MYLSKTFLRLQIFLPPETQKLRKILDFVQPVVLIKNILQNIILIFEVGTPSVSSSLMLFTYSECSASLVVGFLSYLLQMLGQPCSQLSLVFTLNARPALYSASFRTYPVCSASLVVGFL